MRGVMGGAVRKWKVSWAVLQAKQKGNGLCYKEMEGVLGGATSK